MALQIDGIGRRQSCSDENATNSKFGRNELTPAIINHPGQAAVVSLAKQTPTSSVAPSDGQESSVEFSAHAGIATEYTYRGTTLSAHQPAIGAVFEAAFNHFYAGAGVTSVKLPSEPATEIAMSSGVRPKIENIDLDLGWTYYLYPSSGTPPVGTIADINYWEFVARADTSFGDALHLAVGSGFSPNYSNTGAWSDYTAFGIGIDLPRICCGLTSRR
jgi:uncharacterized protein (TIGR02001 family)